MSKKDSHDTKAPDEQTVPPGVKSLRNTLRGRTEKTSKEEQGAAQPATGFETIFPHAASQQSRIVMAKAEIGQVIADKGIYAGTWQPESYQGKSLSQTFYIFAAPEDLLSTFQKAAAQIRDMENWHHHRGLNHPVKGEKPDEVLYKALYSGDYKGEWFIPPIEILKNNLYENRHAFKDEVGFSLSGKPYYAQRYFSCTPGQYGNHAVKDLHFNGGLVQEVEKTKYMMSVRPVRLELVL